MRRQGYEFQVSKPQVIYREIDGKKCEPIERMVADVPQAYAGAVIEKIGRRRGTLESMAALTVEYVVRIGLMYMALRVIDAGANYYMCFRQLWRCAFS